MGWVGMGVIGALGRMPARLHALVDVPLSALDRDAEADDAYPAVLLRRAFLMNASRSSWL